MSFLDGSQGDRSHAPEERNPREHDPQSARIRKLTDKGEALYKANRNVHFNIVEQTWKEIEDFISQIQFRDTNILQLRETEKLLLHLYNKYKQDSSDFIGFLQRSGNNESEEELNKQVDINESRDTKIQVTLKFLDTSLQELLEIVSSKHTKSVKETNSTGSSPSVLARKQAKAEAARARVEYAVKETDLRKKQALLEAEAQCKKANLEADIDLLKIQAEVAVADAEVLALNLSDQSGDNFRRTQSLPKVPTASPMHRTRQYVMEHSFTHMPQLVSRQDIDQTVPPALNKYEQFVTQNQTNVQPPPVYPSRFNPSAATFIPQINQAVAAEPLGYVSRDINAVTSELTRFLLKKELLLSRLTHFTDKPELFAIWKFGFTSIMQELQVTPNEEFDLLVKWLGPESSRHALALRASNVNNPARGLERVWQRLDERFGSPEMVESALKGKLENFPKLTNKDNKKLFDLSDIISEIESAKEDTRYSHLLGFFDSSSGVKPIVEKLPHSLQEKWIPEALKYKKRFQVSFPPFTFFAEFMRETSRARNDPSFAREPDTLPYKFPPQQNKKYQVLSKKTDVKTNVKPEEHTERKCPLHRTNHQLNQCKGFRQKHIRERKELIRQFGFCYRCCASKSHLANDCKEAVMCDICGSEKHPTALHIHSYDSSKTSTPSSPSGAQCGEAKKTVPFSTNCTEVCEDGFSGKSCAKIILVKVYPETHPEKAILTYAVIDDQSNASLAKSELLNLLDISSEHLPYSLSSCAGVLNTSGRRASGLIVESLDGSESMKLPTLIECNNIPNQREEIPTPTVAENFPHLNYICHLIPPLNDSADILLLIGRDLLEAHLISDQKTGPKNTPFAQRLALGWVIVGQACLEGIHKPDQVNSFKTHILSNGRPSLFKPCLNKFNIKENFGDPDTNLYTRQNVELGATVFQKTDQDDKPGMSIEDREFLNIMNKEMIKGPNGNWIAPLPFRTRSTRLPNNRPQALKRAYTLDRSLKKNPEKKKHFVDFMQKIFDNGHAELAPTLQENQECWYLPLFGVYHPQKKEQIRGVFDASAQYQGISLNNVLLTGPDMMNSLLGILLRFRKEKVAITADIEQMFYCFYVKENHRDFLRFLWYQNNNPDNQLVEYRMCVHAFGNSSSPAIATYGLRKTAHDGEMEFGKDTTEFVDKDFYVDDGVTSLPSSEEAIDLLNRTRQSLSSGGNLRLHKIASNNTDVMQAFPTTDLGKDLRNLDLGSDSLPIQRSLGLQWDLNSDTFTFKVSSEDKPYTRRGMLSTVNSLYDPIGFVAPITIQGKLFLRNLISHTKDWDEPLPPEHLEEWEHWKKAVRSLENLHIQRTYTSTPLHEIVDKELYIFSDASEKAIASVAYLKTTDNKAEVNWSFILGKAKVSPLHAHTIPRLELCAAVLAVEISEVVLEQIDIQPDTVKFYTDSKIVLGYINNQTRRFSVYITNRVSRIRTSTDPSQWSFISTEHNPADHATRPTKRAYLETSAWLQGPIQCTIPAQSVDSFPLIDPCNDKEAGKLITTLSTSATLDTGLGSKRFERFSSWKRLARTIANLKHICHAFHDQGSCKGWNIPSMKTVELEKEAELHIIKVVQHEVYVKEIQSFRANRPLPKDSSLLPLSPFVDEDGLLRVGGRLIKADIHNHEKHPLIIPGRHHIALLLIRHHHEEVRHMGRHFTEGAIRSAGLWITGEKRLISSILHKCVKCRKLRGKQVIQKMADLPSDRLQPAPAFTYVGVDVFGPWNIVARRTRGGQANSKRWAVLFTCLSTKSVHLEVIEEMSSSCFINALRRFISIRGNVKEFRSDRGTNFVGAADDLKVDTINVESGPPKTFIHNKGSTWIFNPPHSSHMGGVWERMIGVTRKILDSMMFDISAKNLTHEVLTTFMAEVAAIINARPIVPVTMDAESPEILSPSTLLTHKISQVTEPLGNWSIQDLYKAQWRRVQTLADTFWNRWRIEYLNTLQARRKWQVDHPNVCQGDLIMLKDKDVRRNEWPMGIVVHTFPGSDGKVRKAEIRLVRDGKSSTYVRPISEMVVLMSS